MYGDNLYVLRYILNDYVEIIYLDPPIKSSAINNMIFKKEWNLLPAQTHVFEDTWNWNGNEAEEVFDELIETYGSHR